MLKIVFKLFTQALHQNNLFDKQTEQYETMK